MEFKSVYLLLTPNCNLKCKYCFQEEGYHSREKACVTPRVVDDFIAFCDKSGVEHVEMFGGEPLLHRESFIYSVKSFRERLPQAGLGVVTNGTLIDEEVMTLLEIHPITVLLSLDGRRERHDAFRGGFDRISGWFTRLVATGRVSVALQAGSISGISDHIRYLWDLGFKDVYINVIQNYGWYEPEHVEEFEREYEDALLGMLDGKGHLMCATQIHEMLQAGSFNQRCGIADQGLTCDWRGRFFPCHRAPELGERFVIGNVHRGVDEDLNKRLRESIWDSVGKSASARQYPQVSFCPVNIYQRHAGFSGAWSSGFCEMLERKNKMIVKYHYEIEKYIKEQGQTGKTDVC